MQTIFDEQQLSNYLEDLLQRYGIIIRNDHFVYASGKHGDAYVNKDGIYLHPELINQIVTIMCFMSRNLNLRFSVVAGPALGGIPLAHNFAQHWLTLFGESLKIVILEKDGEDQYVLKRGYDQIVKNQNVLLVEDILTTGKSVGLCIDTLRHYQANVVQIVNIWQRGAEIEARGVPITPLMKKVLPMFEASGCPLCQKGVPVNTKLGKGAIFLKNKSL
ncbi:phosphoribosyltransferase [candidate division KSB1 bacterium]|nr:phosphoribosyltransferase [candidate division KSB1 bacterium]